MSQDQSPSWFYYTADNQRIGPLTASVLKQLATIGQISPDTIIETVDGRQEKASSVRGLKFPTVNTAQATTTAQTTVDEKPVFWSAKSSTPVAQTSAVNEKCLSDLDCILLFLMQPHVLVAIFIILLSGGLGAWYGWSAEERKAQVVHDAEMRIAKDNPSSTVLTTWSEF